MKMLWRDLRWIFPISLLVGLGLSLLSGGTWWIGWVTFTLVFLFGLAALSGLWRSNGSRASFGLMLLLAVVLRLGLGIALSYVLPAYGNDTPVQKAGYIFADAYRRDNQAWDLASSQDSLLNAFNKSSANNDQYGGLLFVSSLLYRLGSPDAHRPWLIILLAALVSGIGVGLAYEAARKAWGDSLAIPVGWIMALFPEAVLLGASQMREPFLMMFISMGFWGMINWAENRITAAVWMSGAATGLLLFSPGVAAAAFFVLVVWFWLSREERRMPWWIWGGTIGVIVLSSLLFILTLSGTNSGGSGLLARLLTWIRLSANYDAGMLERNSGWIQNILSRVPTLLHLPFIIGYGILQPVLPAAIGDIQAVWPMQAIGILRGLGWYAMLPFLIYCPISFWKMKNKRERWAWLWIWIAMVLWTFISSARAGGDQWDNPRYRAILLLFQAALAAQVFLLETRERTRGLIRLIEVEISFVIAFSAWTISRYDVNPFTLTLNQAILIFVGLSFFFLVCDWSWRKYLGKKRKIQNGTAS